MRHIHFGVLPNVHQAGNNIVVTKHQYQTDKEIGGRQDDVSSPSSKGSSD